jgi:hypothetical protein
MMSRPPGASSSSNMGGIASVAAGSLSMIGSALRLRAAR